MNVENELNSSDLSTLEFWEKRYTSEIRNFETHGDVGEIWFGEEAGKRIIEWLANSPFVDKTSKIIDLGCGNGVVLKNLAETGFSNLVGIDFSEKAIELAKFVTRDYNINYIVGSILEKGLLAQEYDVAVDKGTYDAISLDRSAFSNRKTYIENVTELLKPRGVFFLTSCNWTEEELREHFANDFEVLQVFPIRKFQFGGQSGSTATPIVFRKLT